MHLQCRETKTGICAVHVQSFYMAPYTVYRSDCFSLPMPLWFQGSRMFYMLHIFVQHRTEMQTNTQLKYLEEMYKCVIRQVSCDSDLWLWKSVTGNRCNYYQHRTKILTMAHKKKQMAVDNFRTRPNNQPQLSYKKTMRVQPQHATNQYLLKQLHVVIS